MTGYRSPGNEIRASIHAVDAVDRLPADVAAEGGFVLPGDIDHDLLVEGLLASITVASRATAEDARSVYEIVLAIVRVLTVLVAVSLGAAGARLTEAAFAVGVLVGRTRVAEAWPATEGCEDVLGNKHIRAKVALPKLHGFLLDVSRGVSSR